MGRIIGAVVAGYFVMVGVVFVLFSAAYLAMGTESAFKPGSYEPSSLWIFIMFIGGFVAALVGGWVCAKIARNPQGPKWLAVLVIVLGILVAIPSLIATPRKDSRPAGLSNWDAMNNAQTPSWVALANPVIGVAGVLIGGRRRIEGTPPSPL